MIFRYSLSRGHVVYVYYVIMILVGVYVQPTLAHHLLSSVNKMCYYRIIIFFIESRLLLIKGCEPVCLDWVFS